MQLIKLNVASRCDMNLCRNKADYRIATGKNTLSALFGTSGLYLCRDCLAALYEAIGKEFVPKSPDNLVKKAIKRRENNEGK